MLEKSLRYLRTLRGVARINFSIARGQASRSTRQPIPAEPATWEFSGFSQNGEDGILDFLIDRIREPTRYFVEVGSSDGLENNTSWLSLVRRYSGLWIEADTTLASRAAELFGPLNHGVRILGTAATPDNIALLLKNATTSTPDVLSLDIDSYDYFVAEAILATGMRPRIFVAEYNSAFGPDASLGVPYSSRPAPGNVAERLDYGCSISALRGLFNAAGYRFLTVDRNGVNAFFLDPAAFDMDLGSIHGLEFAENFAQLVDCPGGWTEQWQLIEGKPHADVTKAALEYR